MSDETFRLNRMKKWSEHITKLTILSYSAAVGWFIVLIFTEDAHYMSQVVACIIIGVVSNMIYLVLKDKVDTGLTREKWRSTLRNIEKTEQDGY